MIYLIELLSIQVQQTVISSSTKLFSNYFPVLSVFMIIKLMNPLANDWIDYSVTFWEVNIRDKLIANFNISNFRTKS